MKSIDNEGKLKFKMQNFKMKKMISFYKETHHFTNQIVPHSKFNV